MADELQMRANAGRQFQRELFENALNAKRIYLGVKEAKDWYKFTQRAWEKVEDKVLSPQNVERALNSAIRYFGRPKNNISSNKMPYGSRTFSSKSKGKKTKRSVKAKTRRRSNKAKMAVDKNQNKMIRKLQKTVQSDIAHHTYKYTDSVAHTSPVGQCAHLQFGKLDSAGLESACANLRFYNPATPSTLTTASAVAGTYSRKVHFDSYTVSLTARNNYMVPCRLRFYLCTPKSDTSVGVLSYYSDGIADQVISGSTTSPMLYLTDINLVKDAYNVKCVKNVTLEAGKEVTASHTVKDIAYDPSMYDTHAVVFQKKYKAFAWIVRVEGVPAHDTVASQYGLSASGVDLDAKIIAKISYDAGIKLDDISYVDDRDTTFTNGAVVSNKPLSDNQSYSVA